MCSRQLNTLLKGLEAPVSQRVLQFLLPLNCQPEEGCEDIVGFAVFFKAVGPVIGAGVPGSSHPTQPMTRCVP